MKKIPNGFFLIVLSVVYGVQNISSIFFCICSDAVAYQLHLWKYLFYQLEYFHSQWNNCDENELISEFKNYFTISEIDDIRNENYKTQRILPETRGNNHVICKLEEASSDLSEMILTYKICLSSNSYFTSLMNFYLCNDDGYLAAIVPELYLERNE